MNFSPSPPPPITPVMHCGEEEGEGGAQKIFAALTRWHCGSGRLSTALFCAVQWKGDSFQRNTNGQINVGYDFLSKLLGYMSQCEPYLLNNVTPFVSLLFWP